ncbi:hypothetical protein CANARDRAFT_8313 [[Candida] arabinofermentans NRRL YB-2248]|uniref:Coronin n=1 Tax=[Candida] arabinofermentans NRRL YB-2248 TaxID=983967 RepID=A0A1E4SZ25_9ASCO|nr:hypothetical protein CANARDRAFT_8313 [[Candida] arabinofermentans NRRL YB-2248]
MSGRFVRASKYRHVFGQAFKKEKCYENLKATLNAFDSNIIKCNGKYLSLNSNGIGSFIIIPLSEVGKAPDKVPMFRGHTGGAVLDTDFNPFDDRKLASVGEDGKVMLWEIPENYTFTKADVDNIVDVKPIGTLTGHSRKIGHVLYHPTAENVLATSSFDYSVKIWNLETNKCEVTLQHKDLVTSMTFNYNGSLLATASRDKKLRVWDVRTGKLLSEGSGHTGAKSCRVCWLGNTDRIVTTGFDRFSERQLGVWKADALEEGPIGGFYSVDSSSGVLMPFYDPSTSLLFVAGKGDGNIRYFEFENDELFQLSEYQSTAPQRGFAIMPKRCVNIKENEILRSFKLLNDNSIEPISFIVPRRSEMFQDDIYPDAPSGTPALTAAEFFEGSKQVDGPVLLSMADIYEGVEEPTLIASRPPATEVSEPKSAPAPEPVAPVEKSETKPEAKEVTPLKPALTKSQEQGVDDLLKNKEVASLLDKVNNLSDDDTQEVDADDDDEWVETTPEVKEVVVPAKETSPEPVKEASPEPVKAASPEPAKAVTPEPVKAVTPEPVKETIPEPVKETTPEPVKTETASLSKKSTDSPVKTTTGTAAGGLQATITKLQSLVTTLEGTVNKLLDSNLAKDDKLKQLEEKIEQLLAKAN